MLSYHLLLISLIYTLTSAVPLEHYGLCNSRHGDRAACVTVENCDYYPARIKNNPNFIWINKCNINSPKKLICCPNILTNTKRMQTERLPEPPNCGLMLTNRIYGGNETEINEHPWLVRIAYKTKYGIKHNCGGVLLSSRWVLTAAHCVTALRSDWDIVGVRLGEWDTEQNPDCIISLNGKKECAPQHIDLGVDLVLPHPGFNQRQSNFPHDIALMRMERPVTFTQFVKPICLPLDTSVANTDYAGAISEVAGWGRTEHSQLGSTKKLKAELKIWKKKDCKEKFQTITIPIDETHQLCAGGSKGIDTCQGDSGGPLMLSWESRSRGLKPFYAMGIVSFGKSKCGTEGFPGIYTRIPAYIKWIKQSMAEN